MPTLATTIRTINGYRMPRMGASAYRFLKSHLGVFDTTLFPGIHVTIDISDPCQTGLWWAGNNYEYPTGKILQSWLSKASLFFDIGANRGFFSWMALGYFPNIRVHAFEPHPRIFSALTFIQQTNGLQEKMSCWNMGLGEEEAILPLYPDESSLPETTFSRGKAPKTDGSIECQVRRFDAWRESIGLDIPTSPKWVAKIDVEGFELKVLRGMQKELEAKAFAGIVVETVESNLESCGTSVKEVKKFLQEQGYIEMPSRIDCSNSFFTPSLSC